MQPEKATIDKSYFSCQRVHIKILSHTPKMEEPKLYIDMYVVPSISFQAFLYRHLKLS